MSEEKAAPVKKEKKTAPVADAIEATHEVKVRDGKPNRWTLAVCMKAAKRFDSVEAWKHGFPSSYKAAVSRGYDKQCSAHMTTKATVKKLAPAAAKKAPPAPKKLPRAG